VTVHVNGHTIRVRDLKSTSTRLNIRPPNYTNFPIISRRFLAALEELIRQGAAELILPRTILKEFARNKARVIEESSRSLSSTLKRVKRPLKNLAIPGKRAWFCES
jgi:hypothetical protein